MQKNVFINTISATKLNKITITTKMIFFLCLTRTYEYFADSFNNKNHSVKEVQFVRYSQQPICLKLKDIVHHI